MKNRNEFILSFARVSFFDERAASEQDSVLQVLRRDGWRCQSCGTTSNLHVHHKQFRGHSGDDLEENLITLCAHCHKAVHDN